MEKINCLLLGLFLLAINVNGQNSHELIITEIFADPTPSYGLPEKEYVELFNNSGEIIETSNYTLFYNTSSVRLPSYSFEPDTYLILVRKGNGSLFESYGNTLELNQFSLLNSGALLRLENDNGVVAHELQYAKEWYAIGKEEGYSLEMIDTAFPCIGLENWTSSIAEIGGTPGKVNSVNASKPDITPPNIISSSVENREITVTFSESISAIGMDAVSILPTIGLDSVVLGENQSQLVIYLNEDLGSFQDYEFYFDAIQDCSGNVAEELTIKIINRPKAGLNDLLVSEFLFDPFSGGEDFVEIKNVSGIPLDLSGLRFYNRDGDGLLRSEVILDMVTIKSLILEPDSVFCFTRNKDFLLTNYKYNRANRIIELNNFPSMPNENGEIVITNAEGEIIDEINYSSSWQNISLDDPEGVSLERIDFTKPSDAKENWHSTSGSFDFATPGFIPSKNSSEELVRVYPEIITPDGDGITEELSIEFSGILSSKSVSVTVFDRFGGQREKIASNLYVNQGSVINWNGKPASGTKLPSGYYYLFVELTDTNSVYKMKVPFVIAYRN
ncbi:Lamin Tail Domain [Spirosomataceae bacterium TFI 002]|nr:Lamin Tail Domain [Spirosomataceae bacterium TFI 002]